LSSSNWFKQTEAEVRERHPRACLLPIILYHDGVNVGNYQNVTSVLGTCGNYSDEMQRKDKGKFSLGFITNIDMLKLPNILDHLVSVGFNKTAALNEIRRFTLYVNQEFWRLTTKGIRDHYEDGVKLKLLGDRVYQFIPCVPFMVGDDPAQHLVSGVMSNNANRSCIHCMFRQKDRRKYDRRIYPNRDALDITFKCAAAEAIHERKRKWELEELSSEANGKSLKRNRFVINDDERAILGSLDDMSVVPMKNAFHSVYMGSNNSIYNTPPDPFHVFCAGLMKSAVLWIVTIIACIADIENNNAITLVDQRLKDYPYTPVLPHLVNTFFNKGLTSIATKKSKDEKSQATGTGQGYRSSWWVCALIQLFFCIGYHGDVLPNSPNFMANVMVYDKETKTKSPRNINLGNPTSKVLNLIYTMLDVYFECKRTAFTDGNIERLESAIKSMNVHFDLLWDLKQALIDSTSKKPLTMQKNHTVNHLIDAMKMWGCLSKVDTSRYEAAHQYYTTKTFKGTSKKMDTLPAEMLQKNINNTISNHLRNVTGILEHGENYKDILLPQKLPEDVTFAEAGNIAHWNLRYLPETNQFKLDAIKVKKVVKKSMIKSFSELILPKERSQEVS
jgi:hypothetical protein